MYTLTAIVSFLRCDVDSPEFFIKYNPYYLCVSVRRNHAFVLPYSYCDTAVSPISDRVLFNA